MQLNSLGESIAYKLAATPYTNKVPDFKSVYALNSQLFCYFRL